MRYEEALDKHGGYDSLSDFEKGWIAGAMAYAWMKDGTTYVGTTGRTIGDAIDRFLTEQRCGAFTGERPG